MAAIGQARFPYFAGYNPRMSTPHGSGYKRLFAHREMVRDRLRDGVPCRKGAAPRRSAMETEIEAMSDFMEADSMLAERIESWFGEATQRGIRTGIRQGRHEGKAVLSAPTRAAVVDDERHGSPAPRRS